VADAALGAGDGAQKRRVVVVVDPQAKPGAQVLDLGLVKKALSARHLVGDVGAAQGLLKRPGHVVGAVEDGKVLELAVLGRVDLATADRLDARNRPVGFVFFVHGVDHAHGFAFAQF
jgi:hypothetical protein